MVRIGILSDTHGWLRPEALDILRGCGAIVHAGDLGDEDVLSELQRLGSPLYVVRGNSDRGGWSRRLPTSLGFQIENQRLHLIHDVERLDVDPVVEGLGVVISGHTHCPEIRYERGVLHFNPGSAGPQRPARPVTMGLIDVDGASLRPEVVPLMV